MKKFIACIIIALCSENAFAATETFFEFVKRRALKGDADYQYTLGSMYDFGDEEAGVEQDSAEAFKWYFRAAQQGHIGAQFMTGVMYRNGWGVLQNASEAVNWYRKAAEQGHAGAQCNLGVMYYRGEGIRQNYSEAIKWYRKAARNGDETAQNNLKNLGETW